MSKDALQLVYEQRLKQVEQAQQRYQLAQQDLFEQRQQLQNLHQYRRQYIAQLSEKGAAGLSMDQLAQYQQFIVQIDQGLGNQQNALVQFEHQANLAKKQWLDYQVKCKALAMLLDKKAKQRAKIADKKEQALLDEFATFQFFQKNSVNY